MYRYSSKTPNKYAKKTQKHSYVFSFSNQKSAQQLPTQIKQENRFKTLPSENDTFIQKSDINSQDLDEKISKLLKFNDNLNQKLSKQIEESQVLCSSRKQEPQLQGVNFEQVFHRMSKLEEMIQSQHDEIKYIKVIQDKSKNEDVINLMEKNAVYSEMIQQQQQEIQNYKKIALQNQQLEQDNKSLQNKIKEQDDLIQQFKQFKVKIESKIKEVIEENAKLQEYIEIQEMNGWKQDYVNQQLQEKEEEVKSLMDKISKLNTQLSVAEQENTYVKDMKITEIKDFIQKSTPSSKDRMGDQISNISKIDESQNSFLNSQLDPQSFRLKEKQVSETIRRINRISSQLISHARNIQ